MTTWRDDVLTLASLEKVLGQMRDEQREIWHLRFNEELPWKEIGRIIGLKYRGGELTAASIRYHYKEILTHLENNKALFMG